MYLYCICPLLSYFCKCFLSSAISTKLSTFSIYWLIISRRSKTLNKQAFHDFDLVKVLFGTFRNSRLITRHTRFLKKSRDLEGDHHQCPEAKLLRFRRGLKRHQNEEQYLPFLGFVTRERWVTLNFYVNLTFFILNINRKQIIILFFISTVIKNVIKT